MQFIALNESFELVSFLSPLLVQWNRKYYECGDFEIEIQHKQYLNEMKYVYTKDRPEIGIINKVVYDKDKVTLKGYFLNKILDDKIVYPTYYGSGEITQTLMRMINANKEDIRIDSYNLLNGSKVDFQSTGDEVGKKLYEVLATQEMSYNLSYDYVNDLFVFSFSKGEDKTVGDDIVVFSTKFKNLSEPILNDDDSEFKNYALVAGTGKADERIYTSIDLSNGRHKKQLFVDARDMKQEEQSLEQYMAELNQRGLEKLAEHQVRHDISFKLIGKSDDYRKRYDLGDKVVIILSDINKKYEVRIIGIYEVFKDGMHTFDIEVGNMKGV